jgi:hypothetical protein
MKRYEGDDFVNKNIAEVRYVDGNEFRFWLTPAEIKHIRRCLHNRDLIAPSVFKNDKSLTNQLLSKFDRFGDLVPRRIKQIIWNRDKKCEIHGCTSDKVEAHHKRKVANGGTYEPNNIMYLCPKHHDLLELESILRRKEGEVVKTKERIEKLKQELQTEQIPNG